jgi:glycosyltransferase involved in cell wall biosynthesis
MANSLISIIIPVYKVEKYLDRCVESVVNQTYKNLEIILVDDGSPDNCPTMCDEWAKKDNRIKVIHKENGGVSSARNVGLDNATGEYIAFVDSDDYIKKETYKELLNLTITYNADVVICNFEKVFEVEHIKLEEDDCGVEKIKVYEGENRFNVLNDFYVQTTVPWGKMYKKNIFNKIRYPKSRVHEDEFVVHQYLYETQKIVYTSKKLYYYLKRKNSIMDGVKSVYKKKNLDPFCARIKFFREKQVNERTMTFAYVAYMRALLGALGKNNITKEDKKYLNSEYKNAFKKIKFRYVSFKRKVWILAYSFLKINLF